MRPAGFIQSRIVLWVRHERLAEYLALGWICTGPLPGPHAEWSSGVEWLCACAPVFPKKGEHHGSPGH